MSESDSLMFEGSSSDSYDTDELIATAASNKIPNKNKNKSKPKATNNTSKTKKVIKKSVTLPKTPLSSSKKIKKLVKVEKQPQHQTKAAKSDAPKGIKLAAKKPAAAIKLPDHWPVSSQKIPSNQLRSYLPPGNILKKCNGSDVTINKNSDAKPTVGRGKYLFFLPGLLSLRQPSQPLQSSKELSQADTEIEKTDGSQEESKNGDVKDATVKKISSSTLMTLGTVSSLYTDHPKLSIPLPNGQTLQFKGRKLKCSSKHLVLTFKTSGAVNCRNTFQEIVVFGDYCIDGEPANIQESEMIPDEELVDLTYYGGSERAVDGGRDIRGQKKMKIATNNDLSQTQPSQLTQEESLNSRHVDDPSQDIDDDDDDDVEIIESSTAPPRHMPSRKSTSNRKVNYATLLKSDSSDSEGDQNDISEDDDTDSDEGYSQIESLVPSSRKKSGRSTLKKVNYSQDIHSDEDEQESGSDDTDLDDVMISISKQPSKGKKSSTSKGAVDIVSSASKVSMKSSSSKKALLKTSLSSDTPRRKDDPKKGGKTLSPVSGSKKRKKSTPISMRKESPSPKKRMFDISIDDDEFAFMD